MFTLDGDIRIERPGKYELRPVSLHKEALALLAFRPFVEQGEKLRLPHPETVQKLLIPPGEALDPIEVVETQLLVAHWVIGDSDWIENFYERLKKAHKPPKDRIGLELGLMSEEEGTLLRSYTKDKILRLG